MAVNKQTLFLFANRRHYVFFPPMSRVSCVNLVTFLAIGIHKQISVHRDRLQIERRNQYGRVYLWPSDSFCAAVGEHALVLRFKNRSGPEAVCCCSHSRWAGHLIWNVEHKEQKEFHGGQFHVYLKLSCVCSPRFYMCTSSPIQIKVKHIHVLPELQNSVKQSNQPIFLSFQSIWTWTSMVWVVPWCNLDCPLQVEKWHLRR